MRVAITKFRLGRKVSILILITLSATFLMPLLWMISTSLKIPGNVFLNPPQWIPNPVRFENYSKVFGRIPLLLFFLNTLIVAVIPIIGQLLSAPMVAYSVAKVPWKGGKYMFPIILATMMIPWQVTMIPLYSTWAAYGFVNTFVPLVLPAFFGVAYYIFLMRQFIKGIPDSLIEAARIDGSGEVRILYTIIYPLCRPVLTTVALLVFIAHWNDLNGPIIYLQDSSKYVLSIGLQTFLQDARQEWHLLMAAATMFTAPLIIAFFVGQKQFIQGITTTGFK